MPQRIESPMRSGTRYFEVWLAAGEAPTVWSVQGLMSHKASEEELPDYLKGITTKTTEAALYIFLKTLNETHSNEASLRYCIPRVFKCTTSAGYIVDKEIMSLTPLETILGMLKEKNISV